jgi:hypothetical protein
MTPACRVGGSSTLSTSIRADVSTPKSCGLTFFIGFFLAFCKQLKTQALYNIQHIPTKHNELHGEEAFFNFSVPVRAITASGVPGGTFCFYESFWYPVWVIRPATGVESERVNKTK